MFRYVNKLRLCRFHKISRKLLASCDCVKILLFYGIRVVLVIPNDKRTMNTKQDIKKHKFCDSLQTSATSKQNKI